MRYILRGLIVYLFAVALVFNGGAFRVLGGASPAHDHAVGLVILDGADHEQHQGYQHAEHNGAHIAFDNAPGDGHAHIGAKCCTMCFAVDYPMPALIAAASQLRYRAVVFKIGRQYLIGHPVALDPDIPKTIV